jgi:galactose-1-phosphate uridylyltransferase
LGKNWSDKRVEKFKENLNKVIKNLIIIPPRLKPEDKQVKEKLKQKTFNQESAEIKSIEEHNSIMGSLREPIRYFNQMGEIVRQFILSY